MHAIDTNVVIRYITADDPGQAERARSAIERGGAWVSTTVLLECEWVLRSAYGFSQELVIAALRRFAGLEDVLLEAPQAVAQALDWAERGLDFADALHLASAAGQDEFLTFDARLIRRAHELGLGGVRAP